jgi:tetratricopeptide (TPR) repeat protein
MRSNDFKNIGSDVASHRSCTSEGDLKPCFFYDFSTSSGSKSPVAFFRALLQGLRAIMASEPCNLHDDIVFESGSVSSELSALVKPMLKAAVEEYLSFSFLFSGIECLDPDSFQIVLSIFPKGIIPGLWICFLLGTRDAMYCSKMQSVFFAALPCSSMCAMAGSQSEVDAAVTLIQDIQITHSSISIVLQKFRNHPNFCSMAYFLSAICLAFSSCCGADTTQMFIQLAQSTAVSASFSEIICDILLSMHTVPNGPRVFQYLMLCARSRFGLQPSDLIAISNTPSSVHLVCVEILRCLGGCIGCFCIVPFSDVYIAIDKVIESSADPRNVIRLCDSTLLKHFASMPVKWKIIENLLFISEMAGEFGAVCQLLRQYRAQQYILSNEFCSQDFRSFWLFFCRHPAGESISHRSRILKYLSDVKAASKEFCNSIVISAKFCSLISLYETADSILGSFKELYQSDIDDNVAKLKSDDWSHLCLVFALQGRLSLAWGRLDAAESYLKEALAAHGCVMDSDQVASSTSQMFDASRAVSGRLLSEIASVLLVKGKNREALSFADKGSAFIDGIEPSRRNGLVSPSCVLDIMMCAMEARLVNGLKAGAFSIMENALKVCNIEYGKFHPRSISTYERLCSLSSMNLDNTGVLAMYQRILMDLNVQLTWGFDVTGKLTTIILLISDILIASHQPIEAVALCEQALKYRIQRYGSEPNLQVARCLEKLAACRMQAQDPQKATKDLKGALKIRQLLTESKKDQDYFMCVLQLSGALKAAGFRCHLLLSANILPHRAPHFF